MKGYKGGDAVLLAFAATTEKGDWAQVMIPIDLIILENSLFCGVLQTDTRQVTTMLLRRPSETQVPIP